HHRFEKFVRDTFYETPDYLACDKGCYLESIDQFIRCNAIGAIKASHRHSVIFNDEKRYYEISRQMLPLAQRSTAGLFSMFYGDIQASDQIRASEIYV
ncbi:MAG: Zinc dependent phospholipase, partial [Eubacterium sp.]|nr:Zinc dependent phospholipase [Eubacterium sp.]